LVTIGTVGVATPTLLLWVIGLAFALAIGVLALVRFQWALLTVVAVRIALDGLKSSDADLSPGTAVGALFIVLAVPHLVGKAINGTYQPASPAVKGLYCLAAAAAVSAVLSPHPTTAAIAAAQVVSGALMFSVLEQELPENPRFARQVIAAVILSTLLPFCVGLYQVVTDSGNREITAGLNRIYGTAVHPTPFASYLAVVTLLYLVLAMVVRRYRALVIGMFVIGLFLLLNTYTRGAWAAVVVAIVYLALHFRSRLAVPIVLVGLAAFFAAPEILDRFQGALGAGATTESSSLVWRLEYWQQVAPLAAHNPLTGIGLNVTALETPQGIPPHDIFLQAYVEMGALGVFALLAALVGFWRTLRERRRNARTSEETAFAVLATALAIAMVVDGLTSNVLTQAMLYWYFAAASLFGYQAASTQTGVVPERLRADNPRRRQRRRGSHAALSARR
jgi:O-antigen ligase